jgi:hypothetical protein
MKQNKIKEALKLSEKLEEMGGKVYFPMSEENNKKTKKSLDLLLKNKLISKAKYDKEIKLIEAYE